MGRTIHYAIMKDSGIFLADEEEILLNISQLFNSGKLEDVWTCENFHVDPYSERQIDRIISGFVKVQGNEFNSLLVYTALLEISARLDTVTIEVSDEGEFLLCELFIKQRKVLPRLDRLKADMDRWSKHLVFGKRRWRHYIDKKYMNILDEVSRNEIYLNSAYGDIAKDQLNRVLDRYTEVMCRLQSAGLRDSQLCHFNIEHREPDQWFEPELFCREVNPKDYEYYVSDSSKLMDGFEGEGFGLTDEDSEIKSYKVIAFWQKVLGEQGAEIKVLPEVSVKG